MSKKVYLVEMIHHTEFGNEITGPCVGKEVVKTCSTKDEANEWIEENFIRYVTSVDGFCDFKVTEKEVYSDTIEEAGDTKAVSKYWVLAELDKDLNIISTLDFIQDKNRPDLNEYGYFDKMFKKYHVLYLMPLTDIKTRKDVIAYIKKRAAEITDIF